MREGGLGIFPQKKREKKTESFEKLQSILKRLLPEILKGIFHNEKVFHVQACRVSKLRISIASEAEFRLKFLLPTQTHPCEIASTLPLSIQTTWEGPSGEGGKAKAHRCASLPLSPRALSKQRGSLVRLPAGQVYNKFGIIFDEEILRYSCDEFGIELKLSVLTVPK